MPFQQNEQIFSSLMDATPDCVKVLDLEGRLLHMNTPGLCAMEIDDFSLVAHQEWQALWPAAAGPDIEQSIAKAINGESSSFEAYCPTAKGTPKWWDVTVSPVRNPTSGQVERLLSVSRDVTHRKNVEKALLLSETRLAMLHSVGSDPSLNNPDRLARLLRLGIDEFHLESGVIAQISDGVYRVVLADTPDGSVNIGFSCDARDVMCVETIRRNRSMAIESLAKTDWRLHSAYSQFGVEVYFGMPLTVNGEIFGTLCYTSRQASGRKFTTGDHEFLRLLAQTIGTEMTRQQSATRLHAAEAEFRAIFELSPVAMTQVSAATGKFLRVNAKFCELTGYAAVELLNITPEDITHIDDRAGGAEARHALLKGDIELYDREKRYLRKDGSIIWVQANSTLLRNVQGQPDRTTAVIQDITQRKGVEESMRQSEERLQLAVRAGGFVIWETNRESGQRIWSPEAMAIFGLDLPNGIGNFGNDHDEFRARRHPDDRHMHDQYHRELREMGSVKSEYRIMLPGGKIRWISGGASVLTRDAAGAPVRAVHIASDITQRKLVEAALDESGKQFREIVMNLAVPTMLQADDDSILVVNHMWTHLTGYRLADIPTVAAWTQKAYGEKYVRVEEQVDRLFGATARLDNGQATVTTATGEKRLWHFSSTPLGRDAEGRRLLISTAIDITELTQAEADRSQLLKQVEVERGRLREVFRQAPAFMCVLKGPDHVFEMVNDRYHQLVGRREMLGKPVRDAMPEVVDQGFIELLDGVYQTGQSFVGSNIRALLIQQSGQPPQVRYLDFVYEAQRNTLDEISGVLVLGMDVTDRQLSDDKVKASEERFRSLVTATTQIVWTANADGLVTEDSPSWRAFTGQNAEERLGWGWATAMHPDDKEQVTSSWQKAYLTKNIFEAEYRLRRHDGEYRWTLVRGVPIVGADGSLKEWVGTNVDITDAKRVEKELLESEERFRSFADSIPQLAWIADAGSQGTIGWFNKGVLDFAGMTQEQMRGLGWKAIHHPDHIERVVQKFAHHVKNGLDWEDTFPLRRHDGEYRWFLSRMKCIRDEAGKVVQLFGTNTDITSEQQLEEKLRLVADDLFNANRRKDVFLATLAHELRNPLAPIRNGLQLMKLSGGQNDAVDQARAMMERQLTHMVRLVDDLMDASRISQGKLELRKQPMLLEAVINSAIESSSAMILQKRHNLIVHYPAQGLVVDADLTRLAQVFQNLLNNAAKYSEDGCKIHLTVESSGSDAVVTIKDAGVGIAADQLPHIFEMFTQVDRSLDMSQGGLGIGLSLVKQLVDMHGGKVEAKSTGLGHGSEFVVMLPLLDQSVQHGAPGGDHVQAAAQASLKILVVDDNRDGADSLSEMLGLMGNDTRTGYDGEQAVVMAGEYRPDVILLDIGLPKLNGYEVCRLIHEQAWSKDAVLIAVTGWGQDKDRDRTREAGFNHHLVKPVDPQELMKILDGLSIVHNSDQPIAQK